MQCKFPDGSVGVAGRVTKDAEMKYIGDKGTAKLTFGIAAGKRQDTTTIFVNCVAWRTLAEQLNGLKKGDSFCGVGIIKTSDYNGKTYKDLELDWGNSPALRGQANAVPPPQYSQSPVAAHDPEDVPDITKSFAEKLKDTGDKLPF